ncbi:septal ring lytic transglycosylase RlpA family protein [Apibacter sp. HY039]|uniref:septal ring lytic transglycosylase RlpA family protein n=1 Tax=Apibacter sp. HY039 TaxID=2501476 RepID=UPI002101F7B0|nr:septal ring lytic transglycosylase RlpA family protein [Apibacter sp. HY039]
MKRVTLAVVLLMSLSFTAMQINDTETDHITEHSRHNLVKGDTLQFDSITNDTLTKEIIKSIEEEAVELSLSGRVSWYGDRFHGRKTSSGEKYDMNEYTAAHKTLPFGTKVKIRNPKNGKEVIVRITDRGPFVPKRVFDLSKAAFAELTSLNAGVLNVTYEVL